MKLHLILTAALLGSVSLASAQRPGGKGPSGKGPGGRGGKGGEAPAPAEMVKHLSERFASLAAFDTDKSGKLEEAEQTAVAKAIDDGSLEMGPPRGKGPKEGPGGKPPGDKAAQHAAKLYESLAPFDADKSGSLDATEQAAVVKGIEDGSLKLPRPGGPGGPGGRHEGPGGRPEGGPPPPPEGGR